MGEPLLVKCARRRLLQSAIAERFLEPKLSDYFECVFEDESDDGKPAVLIVQVRDGDFDQIELTRLRIAVAHESGRDEVVESSLTLDDSAEIAVVLRACNRFQANQPTKGST